MDTTLIAALAAALMAGATPASAGAAGSAHDYEFTAIDGTPLPLSAYKGRAVLVVNTASQCGFTRQYGPLQALYEKYRDRGLVVIGVPSNDFGGQEPGSEAEIRAFAEESFAVDFPLAAKTRVTGPEAAPFYRWAARKSGLLGKPRWNFHKYLIGPDGAFVAWFSSLTRPESRKLEAAIERVLPKRG